MNRTNDELHREHTSLIRWNACQPDVASQDALHAIEVELDCRGFLLDWTITARMLRTALRHGAILALLLAGMGFLAATVTTQSEKFMTATTTTTAQVSIRATEDGRYDVVVIREDGTEYTALQGIPELADAQEEAQAIATRKGIPLATDESTALTATLLEQAATDCIARLALADHLEEQGDVAQAAAVRTVSTEPITVKHRWMIRRDMLEVLAIERATQLEPWNGMDFVTFLRQASNTALVVEHGEKVIGFICLELHPSRYHVARLAVHPDYQGTDAAVQMLQRLAGKLADDGRVHITVAPEVVPDVVSQLVFRLAGFEGWDSTLRYDLAR